VLPGLGFPGPISPKPKLEGNFMYAASYLALVLWNWEGSGEALRGTISGTIFTVSAQFLFSRFPSKRGKKNSGT